MSGFISGFVMASKVLGFAFGAIFALIMFIFIVLGHLWLADQAIKLWRRVRG